MERQAPSFAGLAKSEWLCFALFVAIGIANIWFHELWRDEFQAFFIARESASIPDLLGKMRYEGHPPLWALWLYLLTRFSWNPFYMQLSHLLIACISAFIILRFPVPRWQKLLMVFGYFSIFEFLTIVRNYALGFLLINLSTLLIMSYPEDSQKKYLLIAPLLFLLCLTSIYGVIIAAAIGLYMILDAREARETGAGFPLRGLIVSGSAVAAGIVLFVISIMPPADRISDIPVGLNLEFFMRRFASVMTGIWRSYVPVPALEVEFWSANIVPNKFALFFLSVILLALSIKLFWGVRKVFIVYCFGTLSILAFSFFVYNSPNLRHFGHLYIIFTTCLVLASRAGPDQTTSRNTAKYFVPVILLLQVVAGSVAVALDWVYPFTAGKAAANYIKSQGLDDHTIIGDEDYILITLSGYLDKPVHHLSISKPATYVTWNKERIRTVEPREIVETANNMLQQGEKVLVALNYELEPYETGNLEKISEFTESVTKDEIYYLYKVNPKIIFKYPDPNGFRFKVEDLVISDIQNRWALVDSTDSRRVISYFNQNRKSYAVQALLAMMHFGINEKITIGNTSFFLVSGKAPAGDFPGEEVGRFDADNLWIRKKYNQAGNGHNDHVTFQLMDGNEQLWDFGCDGSAPQRACDFIKEKGFSKLCRVGSFTFWCKD